MTPQEELFSAIIEEDNMRVGAVLVANRGLAREPKDGFPPMNFAAKKNSRAWVLLMAYGASLLDVDKDGRTPGHYFGANGNGAGMHEYAAAGGDLSLRDNRGKTPIGNYAERDAEGARKVFEYAKKRFGKK